MRVTQLEIARHTGLDVSSVNKILNERRGPKFKAETIQAVFTVAGQLGYDFKANRAGRCRMALRDLIEGGHLVGLSNKQLKEYKKLAGVA